VKSYTDVPKSVRNRYTVGSLKNTRLPHESVWQEIGNLALPFRLRLTMSEYNRKQKANNILYNSTATKCLRVFQSGLMTAAVDPTSQWLSMTTEDPERAEYGPHRRWLDEVGELLLGDMEDSNVYQTLPQGFGNEAAFGFMTLGLSESFKKSTVHSELLPPGSAWFGDDEEGNPASFYREYRATIRQLYLRFGESATWSDHVQKMIDKSQWEEWVDVCNLVEPNEDHKPTSPMAKDKKYSSCWYEIGTSGQSANYADELSKNDRYIKESGFDLFPFLVGRWTQPSGEVYPSEYPGSDSLPDNKTLQIGEKRYWQLVERGINPHFLAAASMRGELDEGMIPGKTSFLSEKDEGKIVRAAYTPDPSFVSPLREGIQNVEERIMDAFHYRTFSMFDTLDDKIRTATEILERKAEKLLKLVDMYTNLQIGVLRPMADYFYDVRARRGMLPPPPPDLQGHQLTYKFNGVLAQAQKMSRVQPIQFVIGVAQTIAQAQQVTGQPPQIFDKFDADQAIDEIATDIGVPASVIRSDAEVAAIRQERQAAIAQQQKMAAINQATQAAKNLGQAKLDDDTALGALVGK
jgi:hypothetical protein